MTEPIFIDDLLSEAQMILRDGHHDHLARAIARVRNVLSNIEQVYRNPATSKDIRIALVTISTPLVSMDGR